MSSTEFKNFIFASRKTGRVLAIRRSEKSDFKMVTSEFRCFTIISEAPLFFKDPLAHRYSIAEGFTAFEDPASLAEDSLIQKKIEILCIIKLNVEMVQERIRANLNRKYVGTIDLEEPLAGRVEALIRRERALGLLRSRLLMEGFIKRVESASSLESVRQEYDHLKYNCNIGSYAKIGDRF